MAFQPGTRNNEGRPPGSKNRNTAVVRQAFEDFINNNLEGLQRDFDELTPRDRFKVITDLASYVLPKLKSTTIESFNSNQDLMVKLMNIPDRNFDRL